MDCWSEETVGPQGAQSASVAKSVERSIAVHLAAANTALFEQTLSYRTILEDCVLSQN